MNLWKLITAKTGIVQKLASKLTILSHGQTGKKLQIFTKMKTVHSRIFYKMRSFV